MILKTGDMFTTTANAIGHGCNSRGVMGAGVAALVREKYPTTYGTYRRICERGDAAGGNVIFTLDDGMYIFNMITQIEPGRNADLDLIEKALQHTVNLAIANRIDRVAVPQIGCGIGGLRWHQVSPLFTETERDGFEWEVWTLD